MTHVYVVTMNWAFEGDSGVDTTLFKTYESAKAFFDKTVQEEKTGSWVESAIIDGVVQEGYELDETKDFWEVWSDGEYTAAHTSIQIITKELN